MSTFKCDKCGNTLIDCGLGVFKTPREIELEACVKELDKKLKIAEEALNYIYRFDCDICKNLKLKCDSFCDNKVDEIIEQILQKMKEVKQ